MVNIHYQYHCACCDKVVTSSQKVCTNCGSQNIRTPYGFWVFCVVACLIVAVTFKLVHVFLHDHQNVPVQKSFLEHLNHSNKTAE